MAVIAIARELGVLGEETAEELASLTGYRLVGKTRLENRLEELGLGKDRHEKYDEKKPGFWASLSRDRDDYLHYLKTAVFEECRDGACIIIGRGASSILKDLPSLLSVRIVAPLQERVKKIMKRESCDERHALQIIEQSDHDRSGFHRYYFSVDWADPRNYDITLDSARLDPVRAAKIIECLRDLLVDEEAEKGGRLRAEDLLLGQRLVTAVTYQKKIPVHFFEASVRCGKAVLQGIANDQSAVDAAMAEARATPGISSVESDIQLVQEFTAMP